VCDKVKGDNNRPVWQGVSMDSLNLHLGPPYPTLLRPAGGPPPKRPYNHFWGSTPAGKAACGRLLPPWTSHHGKTGILGGGRGGWRCMYLSNNTYLKQPAYGPQQFCRTLPLTTTPNQSSKFKKKVCLCG
jgi:hypothetical protein